MKHSFPRSIATRAVMLMCLLGLSSFSLAADSKATPATKTSASQSAAPAASAVPAGRTVNINTATAEEIAGKLKGIGLKKAQAIVAYREANGQFTRKEGLTAVKGIGDSILMQNSELISLK